MLPSQHQEYVAHRVRTASPVELIRILYETAVQSMDEALRALNSGDILARGRAVTKTIEILSELRASLRFDVQQEYCNTLAGLYGYMQTQLIRAHAEQSENLLLEVSRLLHTLQEGWTGAIDNLRSIEERSEGNQEAHATAAAANGSNPYSAEPAAIVSRSWQL